MWEFLYDQKNIILSCENEENIKKRNMEVHEFEKKKNYENKLEQNGHRLLLTINKNKWNYIYKITK